MYYLCQGKSLDDSMSKTEIEFKDDLVRDSVDRLRKIINTKFNEIEQNFRTLNEYFIDLDDQLTRIYEEE